jgi:hypothetical protein
VKVLAQGEFFSKEEELEKFVADLGVIFVRVILDEVKRRLKKQLEALI